jgi:ketosteroid isomerase-like protein
MSTEALLFEQLYAAFNRRDVDTLLPAMHPEVDWPNGWEGGRVHGREAVRDYWLRQWAAIDPRVEPRSVRTDQSGRTVVDVHSVVRDRGGKVIANEHVQHVYVLEDGLVRSMEIRRV